MLFAKLPDRNNRTPAEQSKISHFGLEPLVDKPTHDRIEQSCGDSLEVRLAFACGTLCRNHVVALLKQIKHSRQYPGSTLGAATHARNTIARAHFQSRRDCSLVAKIPAEEVHLDARILCCGFRE